MSYTSIPEGLSQCLPHPQTPWHVNEELFADLQFTPDKQTLYKRSVVTEEHPEWHFIHTYFNHQMPEKKKIKRIWCVHNPAQTKAFEQSIPSMEEKAGDPYFAPQWREKDPQALRDKVLQVWQQETTQFNPFCTKTKRADGAPRKEMYERVKILPLWHGSSEVKCDSIAKVGFARFGKQTFVEGEGDEKSTDIGIFGDGIYFTNSAKYASEVYGQGHLLLSWVSMREPFPIISHTKVLPPGEPRDIKLLKGQGAYGAHNAHYIHVTLAKDEAGHPVRDKRGKLCYYPITQGETPCYNEVIVFEAAQTLPRFWIELEDTDSSATPTPKRSLPPQLTDVRLMEFEELLSRIPIIKQNRYPNPEECYTATPQISQEDQERITKAIKELSSLFLVLPDLDEMLIKKMYGYLFCLFPFLDDKSISNFLRTNGLVQRLLNQSPLLKEEQRKLSLHLAFWHIKQGSDLPLDRKLSLYSQAMSYFALATKIAAAQADATLTKEMHLLSSQLLLDVARSLLFQNSSFRTKLEMAGKSNQRETFKSLFSQIDHLKRLCCKEDDKEIIRELYDLVKDVISNNFSPTLQENYGSYVAEAYKLRAQPFDLPREKATERYERELKHYRTEFKTLLSQDPTTVRAFQKNTFKKLKELFGHILDDTLTILGPPPCACDIRAMGSIAREEMGPFSDVKLMIFIEDENQKEYFRTLVQILNLQMKSLGESIPVHLLFTTLSHKASPLGFHLNPEASPDKDPSLIRTFSQLENFPRTVSLASIPSGLSVEEKITRQEGRALKCLKERTEDYQRAWKSSGENPHFFSLKSQYIEPLNLLLADLGLYFGLAQTNSLDLLDALQEGNIFTPQTALLIRTSLSSIYALRVQMHMHEEGRQEELSSSQRRHLEKVHLLILRPLYNRLQESLAQPEQFEKTFTQLDLIQDAFVEAVKASDPVPFTSVISHIALFLLDQKAPQEAHLRYFDILSRNPKHEPFRFAFFEALQKEGAPQELLDTLLHIPNRAGQRLAYTKNYAKFYESLADVTQTDPEGFGLISSVKVVCGGLPAKHLKKEAIEAILDETGHIKKTQHTDSAHAVASTRGLYFKEMPSQPLMEYAIHNLFFRLGGHLSPTNELVRLEVTLKGQTIAYPLLISQEVSGLTLKEALKKNPTLQNIKRSHLTSLLLSSLLTRPGDGRLSNYILHEDGTIFCIDNDISFIEPVMRRSFSTEINFCCALFCLPTFSLDPVVLQQFVTLDINAILEGWLTDIIETEKKYTTLFSEAETKEFYTKDPDNRFTATILFKEGTLITLNLQFLQLQKYFQSKRDVQAADLLTQLISIIEGAQSGVGKDIHSSYTRATGTIEDKLKKAVGRKEEKSLTSAQHLQRTFSKIPTWDEIQKKKAFSPTKAKEELLSSLLKILGATQLKNNEGKLSLQGDFSGLRENNTPDEVRQNFVLKALQFLAGQQDHTFVILRHCTILNTTNLEPFLKETLEHLDISYCPQIRSTDIVTIQRKCPNLKTLSIEGCDQLEKIEDGLLFTEPLLFEHLENLSAKKCLSLRSVRLKAPQLKSLSLKKTEALATVELDVLKFPKLDLEGSSCINLKVSKEIALAALTEDPMIVECLSPELRIDRDIMRAAPIFGKRSWLKHFGEIGEEPPLPPDIGQILQSSCSFWPDKKVGETHMLVLLPKTVNGEPLTLNSLEKFVKRPKQGPATQYRYYWDEAKKTLGDQPLSQSSWVLMTKDVLPESRSKSYVDQCKLVEDWSQKTKIPYQVPGTLESATCILLEYVQSGTRLYRDSPYTYTRCHEKVAGYQMAVGGFAASGLFVRNFGGDFDGVGVASLRKF